MTAWLRQKVLAPIRDLLLQGITPRAIALSMAVGLCLSTFPLLGITSVFCLVAAMRLRLNLVAIQLINWLSAPLQVALLVPYYRAGQKLFSLREFPMTPAGLAQAFRDDFGDTFAGMWEIVAGGAAIWLVTMVPAATLFFLAINHLLRRWRPAPEASIRHA